MLVFDGGEHLRCSVPATMYMGSRHIQKRFPVAHRNNLKMKGHMIKQLFAKEWKTYENITMEHNPARRSHSSQQSPNHQPWSWGLWERVREHLFYLFFGFLDSSSFLSLSTFIEFSQPLSSDFCRTRGITTLNLIIPGSSCQIHHNRRTRSHRCRASPSSLGIVKVWSWLINLESLELAETDETSAGETAQDEDVGNSSRPSATPQGGSQVESSWAILVILGFR